MKNSITINTAGLPKGKIMLMLTQPRKPKGIIERLQSLFGKKFIDEELVQSYYRKGQTIFVKSLTLEK